MEKRKVSLFRMLLDILKGALPTSDDDDRQEEASIHPTRRL